MDGQETKCAFPPCTQQQVEGEGVPPLCQTHIDLMMFLLWVQANVRVRVQPGLAVARYDLPPGVTPKVGG